MLLLVSMLNIEYYLLVIILVLSSTKAMETDVIHTYPVFNYEGSDDYNVVLRTSRMDDVDKSEYCSDTTSSSECYIDVERTFDVVLAENWNKKIDVNTKYTKAADIEFSITNVVYTVSLNYMYTHVKGDNYAGWWSNYYSSDGEMYKYCDTNTVINEMVSASGKQLKDEVDAGNAICTPVIYKRFKQSGWSIFGTKCSNGGTDDVWFCVARTQCYDIASEMIMVFQMGSEPVLSADISVKFMGEQFSANLGTLTDDEQDISIDGFGTVTLSGIGTIVNPLSEHYLLVKGVMSKDNRTFVVNDYSYARSVPDKGQIISSGLGEYQVVRPGSSNLLYDKSKLDDWAVGSCGGHNKIEASERIEIVQNYLNSESQNIRTTLSRNFVGEGNSSMLRSTNKWCCPTLINPSSNYINVIWSNYLNSKEELKTKGMLNDITASDIILDNNLPSLKEVSFSSLSTTKTTARLLATGLKAESNINWQKPENIKVSEIKVMTNSQGSYLKLDMNVSDNNPGRIRVWSDDAVLSTSYLSDDGSNIRNATIGVVKMTRSNVAYITICAGSENDHVCADSPTIDYIEPEDGGTDDPDDGSEGSGVSLYYTNFIEYMYTGIITAVVCTLIFIIDAILLIVFLGVGWASLKNGLFIVIWLLTFTKVDYIDGGVLPSCETYEPKHLNTFDALEDVHYNVLTSYGGTYFKNNLNAVNWGIFSPVYMEFTSPDVKMASYETYYKNVDVVDITCTNGNVSSDYKFYTYTMYSRAAYSLSHWHYCLQSNTSCMAYSMINIEETDDLQAWVSEKLSNGGEWMVILGDGMNVMKNMGITETSSDLILNTLNFYEITEKVSTPNIASFKRNYFSLFYNSSADIILDVTVNTNTKMSKYGVRLYRLVASRGKSSDDLLKETEERINFSGTHVWLCSNITSDGYTDGTTGTYTLATCLLICLDVCYLEEDSADEIDTGSRSLLNSKLGSDGGSLSDKVKNNYRNNALKRSTTLLGNAIDMKKSLRYTINECISKEELKERVYLCLSNMMKSRFGIKLSQSKIIDILIDGSNINNKEKYIENLSNAMISTGIKESRDSIVKNDMQVKAKSSIKRMNSYRNKLYEITAIDGTDNIDLLGSSFIITNKVLIPIQPGNLWTIWCDCNTVGTTVCYGDDYYGVLLNTNDLFVANTSILNDVQNKFNISRCGYGVSPLGSFEGKLYYNNKGGLSADGDVLLLGRSIGTTELHNSKSRLTTSNYKDGQKFSIQQYRNGEILTKVASKSIGCAKCKFNCMMSCAKEKMKSDYDWFFWSPLIIIGIMLILIVLVDIIISIKRAKIRKNGVISKTISLPKRLYNRGYMLGTSNSNGVRTIDKVAWGMYQACPMLYWHRHRKTKIPANLINYLRARNQTGRIKGVEEGKTNNVKIPSGPGGTVVYRRGYQDMPQDY